MGLFLKLKEPIFIKEDSSAVEQLEALRALKASADESIAEKIEQDIRNVEAGIYGENAVKYELLNSHIPMYVLQDLYLEHEGLTAQIDFLVITRMHQYVIECKNLYGNIEVTNTGNFIRTVPNGRYTKKEGIYSPITQNRRHLELIKQMRSAEKNVLSRLMFEKYFDESYRSLVVLANTKTVLNDRYAKKEIKDQMIRADQLAAYIRKVDAAQGSIATNEKNLEELVQWFLKQHKPQHKDYTEKYRVLIAEQPSAPKPEAIKQPTPELIQPPQILCPKCGADMVKRTATKGANAGQSFYGCSAFPKCRSIVACK